MFLNKFKGKTNKVTQVANGDFKLLQKEIVNTIITSSAIGNELVESTKNIEESISSSVANLQELSAVTEELSANSETVAELTLAINNDIQNISENINNGNQLIESISIKSTEQQQKGDDYKNNLQDILEKAKSIEKISLLTETIVSISDDLRLLGMNALIEAGRAGENGKGFAVVAEQVVKLADYSKDSSKKISNITNDITNIIQQLFSTIQTTIEFFMNMSTSYKTDSESIKEMFINIDTQMKELANKNKEITTSMAEIAQSTVQEAVTINSTANEASNINQKVNEIVNKAEKNYKMLEGLMSKIENINT